MTIPRTLSYGTRPAGGSSGSIELIVRVPTAPHDSATTIRYTRLRAGQGPSMAHYHDQAAARLLLTWVGDARYKVAGVESRKRCTRVARRRRVAYIGTSRSNTS